ncbi:MAG: YHS domain-containing (seleno)protein [Pseudomonadales bacterium]
MIKSIKRTITVLLASSVLMAVQPALADDEFNVVPGLTAAGAPLALHGIDPVAFLELGNRIEGSATHTAVHDGVAYYFASADNKKTFEKRPDRFTPQNGGFCTFGVSVGKKFDGDPNYADVVDGKLYVFLNEDIFKMYQKDRDGTIKKARSQWRKIRHTAANEL